jgi:tartrate dehydrogenase/decarboxylase/D-malate dehydrogenase
MLNPLPWMAFEIAGKGANPIGTFWSAVLLLEHLGEKAPRGVSYRSHRAGYVGPSLHTQDLGGTATTAQVTDAVCTRIAETAGELAPA